eukprot:COSAG01_NODE_645_length_14553_cov_32.925227_14_plen_25_part_01
MAGGHLTIYIWKTTIVVWTRMRGLL